MSDSGSEMRVQLGPPKGSRGKILGWYATHPLVGAIATFVSIGVGIGSLYFSAESVQKRELRLWVHPVRTLLVRSGRSSDLQVLYKRQPVSTDVAALQVGLWNAGGQSIKPENVLDPIILQTTPKVPILEARLHFITRPVTKVSLDTSHIGDGKVGVSWRILEHDDGAVIQLIVAGGVDEGITALGTVEGQSSIVSGAPGSPKVMLLLLIPIIILPLLALSLRKAINAKPVTAAGSVIQQRSSSRWWTLVFFGAQIAMAVLVFFVVQRDSSPGPLRFDATMTDDRPPPQRPPGPD